MTKEQAIEYIKAHCNPDYPNGKTQWGTAMNMAIDALMKQLKVEKEMNRITKLKPCPYRIHYNETFMPCMQHKCPCFHCDCGDAYCDRDGVYRKLGEMVDEADDKTGID